MITRDQVKKEDTWDLESIYKNDKAWKNDFDVLKSRIKEIAKYQGKLNNTENILDCLTLIDDLDQLCERIYQYAELKSTEDLSSAKNKIRLEKIKDLNTFFVESSAFVDSEILEQEKDFIDKLSKDDQCKEHSFYLEKLLRKKKHVLSMKEEKMLANFTSVFDGPSEIFTKFNNTDIEFDPIIISQTTKNKAKSLPLTSANFLSHLSSPNRKIREQAAINVHKEYGKFRHTLAETLSTHIKNNVLLSRSRKYSSVMDSFLHGKSINKQVYKTLFSVTNKNLPLLHKYMDIRKRILGYKKFYWHDLYAPVVEKSESKFSFDKAVDLAIASVQPLGNEYVDILTKGLRKDRWVDKYENKGKRGGAFSSGGYRTRPFILHNYTDTIYDVYTLAHECGHSMHTYMSTKNQPYALFGYGIFLAEIASTTNEQFLSHHLLQGADKKLRIAIVSKQLEDIRATFFRQTMFAEFEELLYNHVDKNDVLTTDFIEDEYLKLNKKYYGPSVVIDDYIKHEWSRIPHFYYNFYVYQYATGLASAQYFSQSILNGGDKELGNYLNLLKAGGSDYQTKLLKKSGVDVSKSNYLEVLMKKFEDLLNEFKELTA